MVTIDITVTEPWKLEMCGEVNDSDMTNAAGDCLKVATDDTGMLFTGTPSRAVVDALGYVQADGNDNTNDGETYANIYSESGANGLVGFFARFDQLLINGDNSISAKGVDGQYDRWCKNLSDMSFNGRTDWRRASLNELQSLYGHRGNMYTGYGWASISYYWSSSVAGSSFYGVGLDRGYMDSSSPSNSYYASCVSLKVDALKLHLVKGYPATTAYAM